MPLNAKTTPQRITQVRFGNPDAGVKQGFDDHDVAAAAGGPDGLVAPADLVFGGDVGSVLGAWATSMPSSARRCRASGRFWSCFLPDDSRMSRHVRASLVTLWTRWQATFITYPAVRAWH
jgi:hypothetical protein